MAGTPRRRLLRLDLKRGSTAELAEAIAAILDETPLRMDDRVQLLGGALVMEALRPFWTDGRTPLEAHEQLRAHDPELADAIEAIAPMLLGRAEVREESEAAVSAVEELLLRSREE